MITTSNLYHVVEAMAPLYTAMALGYAAVRWWRVLSPDQCNGINHFVALFPLPILAFRLISSNNPYTMNTRLLAADSLQKLFLLAALFAWSYIRRGGGAAAALPWVITVFCLATLPNTVIMGIPLLRGMYGPAAGQLMVQIVVVQSAFWWNFVLFLYEYISARHDIMEQEQMNSNHAMEFPPLMSVWRVPVTVGRKLIRMPRTHAAILGLLWSLIAFRLGIKMPAIIDDSLSIISVTATGLSMFCVGTFIAQQSKFISCGYSMATFAVIVKFIVGPGIMVASSLAVGLQGLLLHVAAVQAALPLATVSFVYAKEYNVHPDIMSSGVIIGTFISVPITILYYILLGLQGEDS
ncbi:probable auxin efflux carrier component 9 isoform X2 [Elaeis guineensis]|uniref:Probable auxin efflux carrier component 1b n=1 Tax=Elaeis guineensis var. tenera TaxID=51953 RepID=A0A6I9QCB5_ELAGV|nr:probable auxin efflux carrier component 1b [Elaeis guineensis]